MEHKRCGWAENGSAQLKTYHDEEWGKPVRGERELFELLILESFHSGLSWQIVLHKREAFRAAMDQFDPVLIAAYDSARLDALMQNARLIRHRGKFQAAITNARCFLAIQPGIWNVPHFHPDDSCRRNRSSCGLVRIRRQPSGRMRWRSR